MTTINNLINQVGGIEKAKRLDEMLKKHAVPEEWKISIINGMWHRSTIGFTHNDLRTAIAQHERLGDSEGFKAGQQSRQAEVDEKDKRINRALNLINNWWHPDLDQKLFVEALGRALRGN